MSNRVACFEKVSFEEFKKSLDNLGYDFPFDEVSRIYESIKIPERSTSGSAGYDFRSPFDFTLTPGNSLIIPTGIRCSMEDGWLLSLFPRSGLGFKYRMQLDNTVGIIDSDYYYSDNEGHIMAKVTNDSLNYKELKVEEGQGFIQGIFLQFGITHSDCATNKRNGGFGSTDKK